MNTDIRKKQAELTMHQKTVAVTEILHPYLKSLYTQVASKNYRVYEMKSRLDLLKGLRKASIIHLHWIESYLFKYGHRYISPLKSFTFIGYLIFIKYILRKKIVITLHNLLPHRMLYPVFERKMFGLTLKLADGVIVHNDYSKKMACRMHNTNESKIRIIPIGHFFSYYSKDISKQAARDILKIPENKFVMLFFGGIRSNKGLEDLLTILEDILVTEKDLFLVVGGKCYDVTLESRLKEFSNKFKHNSLVKTEYIPDEDIQIFMNASDVGILPYREITTSGALLLYISFRKPVIVADLEPIKELLEDSGIYYKHGDGNDLVQVILEAKSGSYNLEKLSQEVFELSQKFQWDDIADKTVEFYNDLLSRSSK